ncbi:hypothetical protein ACFQ12_25505, partial [Methylobacterium trifolii]
APLADLLASRGVRVANNAALKAWAVAVMPVTREGYAAAGDGGRATYTYAASACAAADDGSQVQSTVLPGCWSIDWSSIRGEATPELFGGAVGFTVDGAQGTPDAQPAVQKALDTGRPVRFTAPFYRMGRSGIVRTPGQEIAGLGPNATALVFHPGYDTGSGAGVLTLSPAVFAEGRKLGPIIRDLRIKGFQPEVTAASDTGTSDAQRLASLVQTSCIDARGGYGAKFVRLILTSCMRGLDLRGDVGEVMVDDLTGSNFITDIDIDGALSTIRIHDHHNFPVNVTPNQAALAQRSADAIRSGRMDDLKVTDSMCIQAKRCIYTYKGVVRTLAADGYPSPGGITTASFSNYDFDIVPLGWQVDDGVASFTGGYYASAKGGVLNAGTVSISGTSNVNMNGDRFFTQNGGIFSLTGIGGISDPNGDNTFLYQTGGFLTLVGSTYGWNGGVGTRTTKPKVWSTGGTIVATGNTAMPRGAGTQAAGADFFRVDTDGANVVANNATPGWTNTFPANSTTGIYLNNRGGATEFTSGFSVTGVGAGISGGGASGCHHSFQASTGYIQCVQNGIGWMPLNIDALAFQVGSQNTGMVVRMYGTGGVHLKGHLSGSLGTAPTITTSAGTATPSTGINDTHGTVTVTAAATVTVKFTLPYANPPDCLVASPDGAKPTWRTTAGAAGRASL